MSDASTPGGGATTRTLGRDDWVTDPDFFNKVNDLLRFDFDACAVDAVSARVPAFISPEMDGLSMNWGRMGQRGWCNNPYSAMAPWLKKCEQSAREDEVLAVNLGFARLGRAYWWKNVVTKEHASFSVIVKSRLRFRLPMPDGTLAEQKKKGPAPPGVRGDTAPDDSVLTFYTPYPRVTPGIVYTHWDWRNEPLEASLSRLPPGVFETLQAHHCWSD